MSKKVDVKLFGGACGEQENALAQALVNASGASGFDSKNNDKIYRWLEETPKTFLIAFLVLHINELEYKITKKERLT